MNEIYFFLMLTFLYKHLYIICILYIFIYTVHQLGYHQEALQLPAYTPKR